MNGFKIMADSYKQLVEQGKMTEEQARRSIEIYEILASCDKDDFCQMVDSSAFNDIIRAFLTKAIKSAELDEMSENKVMKELQHLFDDLSAKEILNKYS